MTEFENILNEANKKNGNEQVAVDAPADKEKRTYGDLQREKKQQCYSMIDDACVDVVSNGDRLRAFLDVQSRLERYSLNNNLLIFTQKPEATKLKDFKGWQEAGATIQKGAKSILILEPSPYKDAEGNPRTGYNAKNVFDISDVENVPESEQPIKVDYTDNQLVAALVNGCPVAIQKTDADLGKNVALYDAKNKVIFYKQVGEFNQLFPDIAKARAHAEMAKGDANYRVGDHEFQAKCAAYIIVKKYEKDTSSLDVYGAPNRFTTYEPDAIKDELNVIHSTAKGIAGNMRAHLEKDKVQEQKQEQTQPAKNTKQREAR